jgi:hypothetical protein
MGIQLGPLESLWNKRSSLAQTGWRRVQTKRVKITSDWSIARLRTIFHTHHHPHIFRAHIPSLVPPDRTSRGPVRVCAQNFVWACCPHARHSHRIVFARKNRAQNFNHARSMTRIALPQLGPTPLVPELMRARRVLRRSTSEWGANQQAQQLWRGGGGGDPVLPHHWGGRLSS